MTAVNAKLGASFRLYVAKVDSPANDASANWGRATNENDINYQSQSKTTDHEMKENGGEIVTLGGPVQYSLSTSGAMIYDDTATAALQAALGDSIHIQVRYVDSAGTETVKIEGQFLVSEFSEKFPSSGAGTFSVNLMGAGAVTFNATPRALITT